MRNAAGRNKGIIAGNVLLGLGIFMVLMSACIYGFNRYEDMKFSADEQVITDKIKAEISQAPSETEASDPSSKKGSSSSFGGSTFCISEIDGCLYDGYLTIPAADLEIAVFDDCSEKNLKKGACRYYGSPETDDLIIAGHNYKSTFGKLRKLSSGDKVYFTDMAGNVSEYIVKDIEVIGGTEISRMLNGDWDLTLYTCTYGGRERLTIRCERSA